jgi:uncharacterized membrane protein
MANEMLEYFEATFTTLAAYLQTGFEAASVLVVGAGGIALIVAWLSQHRDPAIRPRHTLARYLVVGLELQLAADIIATATDPTLEELGKLAAIAGIRTFLNYFLVEEMKAEQETA